MTNTSGLLTFVSFVGVLYYRLLGFVEIVFCFTYLQNAFIIQTRFFVRFAFFLPS
jgi:hypothetical protein